MEGSEGSGWALVSPLLTPALMVYYLCCWPGETNSETSSEKSGRSKPAGGRARARARAEPRHHESVTRRASDLFHRKIATSVVSLHLPSTSGAGHKKEPLSAHRSHEEMRGRAGGHGSHPTSRYHSAPSVIDEVLHRRDWERSTRDLHIPLRSPEGSANPSEHSGSELSPPGPRAEPDSSSIEDHQTDDRLVRTCKKHFTNIKSSKRKERDLEDKDCDATELPDVEPSNFYIGDNDTNVSRSPADITTTTTTTTTTTNTNPRVFKAKEAKQSFNESIRRSDSPRRRTLVPLEENLPRVFGFSLDDVIDRLDRSGATHHTMESRSSLRRPPHPHPPPSVEAVGYEGAACYLSAPAPAPAAPVAPGTVTSRARHASDGDILAGAAGGCRPESGAFSESDLDLDLDLEVEVAPPAAEEVPPPYEDLHHFASPQKKETAI